MSTSDIIASSALVIATLSFLTAVWQARLQRLHNANSLKPIAQLAPADYENKLFVKLVNCGVGPLIITNSLFYNGIAQHDNLIDFLPTNIMYDTFHTLYTGRVVPANDSVILFEKSFELLTNEDKAQLRSILKDIKVRIEYEDIYQNSFVLDRNLAWFGRHGL